MNIASDFKLKIINVFVILVIYSLPTKQDAEPSDDISKDKSLQGPKSQIEDQLLQAGDEIRKTIEEPDKTQTLQSSEDAKTLETNNDQKLDGSSDDFPKGSKNNESQAFTESDDNKISLTNINQKDRNNPNYGCWLKLDAANHFKILNELDEKYSNARHNFNKRVVKTLNKNMLGALLNNRGIAYRALHKTAGDPSQIPAGLNLGGYSMLRMQDSLLFFHRMKLRNNTVFRVDFFENDLVNMLVNTHLCLNDIHLVGAYERSAIHEDPSILFYAPSYGEIEILLKKVYYNMEGRLRLQNKRLVIEVVDSELILKDDILMTYLDSNDSKPMRVRKENLDDFLERMKNDLDLWLKDYFNDYYTYFQLNEEDENLKTYEKKRLIEYNKYAYYAITAIRQRIYDLGIFQVKIPKFTLFSIPNVQVKLSNGVIRGLDTMFKRSIATGKRAKDVRYVDMLVGFSNLKVEYTLSASLPNGQPPLVGRLMLTADDLAAHLQIAMVKDPEAVNLKIDFLKQFKPESLIVEGPANKFIANFKHLLENHAIAIMSNALIHNVKMLSTLTRCHPILDTDNRPNAYHFGRPSDDRDVKLSNNLIIINKGTIIGPITFNNNNNNQDSPTKTTSDVKNKPTRRPPTGRTSTIRPPTGRPPTGRPTTIQPESSSYEESSVEGGLPPTIQPESSSYEESSVEGGLPPTIRPEISTYEESSVEGELPPTGRLCTGLLPTRPLPTRPPPTGRPPTGRPPTVRLPTGRPPTGRPPTGRPPTVRPPTGRPPTIRPPTRRPRTTRSEFWSSEDWSSDGGGQVGINNGIINIGGFNGGNFNGGWPFS